LESQYDTKAAFSGIVIDFDNIDHILPEKLLFRNRQRQQVWLSISKRIIMDHNRELLVLLGSTTLSDEALEKHMECLHTILRRVENDTEFSTAHELVARNRITSKKAKILTATSSPFLKPFYFLINKN
jgi:hypothetical protein